MIEQLILILFYFRRVRIVYPRLVPKQIESWNNMQDKEIMNRLTGNMMPMAKDGTLVLARVFSYILMPTGNFNFFHPFLRISNSKKRINKPNIFNEELSK
jgi:hypothetical protein